MDYFPRLLTAITPSGVRLSVHFENAEVHFGVLHPGGYAVLEEDCDDAVCGRFGRPATGGAPRAFWSCEGYDAKVPPAWAGEGEALLRALVDGDELPGWDLVRAGDE